MFQERVIKFEYASEIALFKMRVEGRYLPGFYF